MRGAAISVCLVLVGCGRFGFAPGASTNADGGDDASGDDGDANAQVAGIGSTVTRATSHGGAGNEEAYAVAVASDGTVFIAGTTDGGTFMIGSDTITGAGGEDILLAAFEANGTPRWARRMGGAAGDRAQAIVADTAGNIYVCGLYAGTANFGSTNVTAFGMWDVFVASYTATGAFRWDRVVGGTGADFCYDLALTPAGHVVATGYYEGAIDFGSGPSPTAGTREIFVAQFDGATGVPMGGRGFASTGSDSGQGIAVTASGNLIVTGNLGGPIDFGNGPLGTAGGSFLLELDANRNHVWSLALDSQTTWDVDVDQARDRILLASRNAAGLDLGMGSLPAPGGANALVLSYDSNRDLEWYAHFGGDQSDIGLGISVDANGNAYSIGLGGTDIDFGLGTVNGNAGSQDIWVASHAPDGTVRWGRMFGGAPQDRGYSTAVAPDGGLYISGRWAGSTDFGTGTLTATANDLFLLRLE